GEPAAFSMGTSCAEVRAAINFESMRSTRSGDQELCSRERLLRVGEALRHFLDRRAPPAILVLDVGRNRPPLALQQLQHLANRRVALAPRQVVALVLLPIL